MAKPVVRAWILLGNRVATCTVFLLLLIRWGYVKLTHRMFKSSNMFREMYSVSPEHLHTPICLFVSTVIEPRGRAGDVPVSLSLHRRVRSVV